MVISFESKLCKLIDRLRLHSDKFQVTIVQNSVMTVLFIDMEMRFVIIIVAHNWFAFFNLSVNVPTTYLMQIDNIKETSPLEIKSEPCR